MIRRLLLVLAVAVTALFLGAALCSGAPLYVHVFTPRVLSMIASACKLTSLGAGAVFASRSARAFDERTAIRSAWLFMRAWFVCFFLGQLVLTTYETLHGSAPVPSLGDAFFLLGYVAVTIATLCFIAGYRRSGFAFGELRHHLYVALAATVVFAYVGVTVLGPVVAHYETPLATRLVNAGYPVLDFVLLIPTLVLLRMTFALRGGRVWRVWLTLLLGVMLFTAGDILFAIPGPVATFVSPVSDFCFLLGYALAAAGAGLESELLDD